MRTSYVGYDVSNITYTKKDTIFSLYRVHGNTREYCGDYCVNGLWKRKSTIVKKWLKI